MTVATNQKWYTLVSCFSNYELSFEEARKRVLFGIVCLTVSFLMAVVGAYHFVAGSSIEVLVNAIGSIVLVLAAYFVRYHKNARAFYRLPTLIAFIALAYSASLADEAGFRMLWMYIYPPLALFLLGRTEGLFYSVLLGVIWIVALFVPTAISGPQFYSLSFSLRFVVTYFLVIGMSWFLETVRVHYANSLLKHTSQLELDNEQMQDLAFRDDLTQLPNRRSANHFLDDTLAAAHYNKAITPLIGILDIDRFKVINDHFGHQVGDRVLAAVAQRIRRAIRSEDFVGRYGGEEFLIVIPNASAERFDAILEKIRWAICEQPIEIDSVLHHVTASIGAAPVTSGGLRNELLEAADRALYMAKQQGRNRVVMASVVDAISDEQHTITIAS